jgi:hypothetical protein
MASMHPTRTAVSAILTVMVTCSGCVSSTQASRVPSATDAGSASGSPSPSRSNGIVTPSPSRSNGVTPSASATPVSSLTGGGSLATVVVERMARTPFRTRIDVRATTVTTTDGGPTTKVDATQTGVINDQDFDLQIGTTAAGVVSRAHVVAVGDTLYVKVDEASWQLSDRANAAVAIETSLWEIRRTLNGGDLADVGTEPLDGQTVHHLTMTAPGAIHDPRNPLIVFDAYDLWVLTDGSPVRRTEVIRLSQGSLTSTYTSDTRYSDFGKAITIVAPTVTRSPSPSRP